MRRFGEMLGGVRKIETVAWVKKANWARVPRREAARVSPEGHPGHKTDNCLVEMGRQASREELEFLIQGARKGEAQRPAWQAGQAQ